ncbi:MAG: rfaQ 3 [Pelosinus sp.]|jgi:predicted lipopolysaccharide heptosyltransferase III|nr:rfaQ 3 [Pelosinus sp.]
MMKLDNASIKKILVINLAFIGDVILATPVTRGLRETYPQATIDMLVIPAAAPIAELNPYIDHVTVYDKRVKHKNMTTLWSLIKELRTKKYDLTISTNFALRNAMVAWSTGAPYRVGYDAQHANWFLTHVASAVRTLYRHEAENQLDVLSPLGIKVEDTSLQLKVREEDTNYLQTVLKRTPGKKLVVICPAGSYQRKSWITEGYAQFLQEVSQVADCCLIGGKAEINLLEEINALSGNVAQVFAGNLTLGQVAALLVRADLLLSVDTGPLHIGQAVSTPTLGLFGPTDPGIWGPRGSKDCIIYRPVDCSPCWGKGECREHRCMANILPEEVIGLAMTMLKEQ